MSFIPFPLRRPVLVVGLAATCLIFTSTASAQPDGYAETRLDRVSSSQRDGFGYASDVAADGSFFAVTKLTATLGGATLEVFDRVNDSWEGSAIVSSAVGDNQFGASVAVSGAGDRVVVGAPKDDTFGTFAGGLYVFDRNADGTWTESKISPNEPIFNGGGCCGTIDISDDGTTIVAGLPYAGGCPFAFSGAALVFTQDAEGVWVETNLEPPVERVGDLGFGQSVTMNAAGDRVAVGTQGAGAAGLVFVYDLSDSGWVSTLTLEASDVGNGDFVRFGFTSSMSDDGSTVAVGVPVRNSNSNDAYTGAVYIYDLDADGGPAETKIVADNLSSGRIGSQIDLDGDGNTLVAGVSDDNEAAGTGSGKVFVFEQNETGAWVETSHVSPTPRRFGNFGSSVAVSADAGVVVVGASNGFTQTNISGRSGEAFVWTLPTPEPGPCDEPTIVGTEGDDNLTGTSGPDVIVGLGGNDTINALGGDDIVCAGSGDDIVFGRGGADYIEGGDGRDTLRGNGGADRILGGNDDDLVIGGRGADVLDGEAGNDVVRSGRGADRSSGGAGDDVVRGGASNDVLDGGTGVDTVIGGAGEDVCINAETTERCETSSEPQ